MPAGVSSFSFTALLPIGVVPSRMDSVFRDPNAIRRDLNPASKLSQTVATEFLLNSISATGTAAGSVIASPSKKDPDYFFHWIRDAALTMNTVVDLYKTSQTDSERSRYQKILDDYARFSAQNQLTKNPSGQAERERTKTNEWNLFDVGEPKFEVDGSAYKGAWGRPQDDGPALRVITLMRYADHLANQQGPQALIANHQELLSVIALDLEYIAKNWQNPNFEPWEEVYGHHFYTKLVQRRALIMGTSLAELLGDFITAKRYAAATEALEKEIHRHWDKHSDYLRATLSENRGQRPVKDSELDSQVLLAALHADGVDDFYSVTNDRILATAFRLIQTFRQTYEINRAELPGTVIGRYAEDTYWGGNPWVLTTAGLGELYFRSAAAFVKKGEIRITNENFNFFNFVLNEANAPLRVASGQIFSTTDSRFALICSALLLAGEDQLLQIHYHANLDGALSEQIDRNTGYMMAAPHLTWSYASYLTLLRAKELTIAV